MLFILITIAWLAIATIIIGACRMAARADSIASGRDGRSRPLEIPLADLTELLAGGMPEPGERARQQRLSALAAGRTGRARGSTATARRRPPRVGALSGSASRGRGDRHR